MKAHVHNEETTVEICAHLNLMPAAGFRPAGTEAGKDVESE